jgi:hypothetical protein
MPCVTKGLPHLVEMHKRYSKDGLVALAVNVDENARDPKVQKDVLKRLTDRGVTCTNVILDEEFTTLQKKLRFDALPSVYVFNRQGKWKQFTEFDDAGKTYQEIDKLVEDWLKQ